MYARSTTIRANPAALEDGIAYVRDEVLPVVEEVDGCTGLSMLVDRESGRCIVTTAWADEQALRTSDAQVRPLRDRAAEIFRGTPEVAEWEMALVHRLRPSPEGACTRVIWSRVPTERVDATLDAYRMTMLPKLEDLPGFCSVSLSIDRATGRAASAVTYESRDALTRAVESSTAMRDDFIRRTGVEILDLADFDLVLAHLRVPETV